MSTELKKEIVSHSLRLKINLFKLKATLTNSTVYFRRIITENLNLKSIIELNSWHICIFVTESNS